MRRSLAFLLVTALAACGGGSSNTSDAPDASGTADAGLPPDLQIVTPTRRIPPGGMVSYCYYFRTANTRDLVIKRWASRMAQGSYHMVVYLTSSENQPAETMTTEPCGFGVTASGFTQVWTYSATEPDAELVLPSDDGTGTPVGQLIKAGQAGYIQMHYENTTASELAVHVELDGYAYAEGVSATLAAPFITYRAGFELKPGSAETPTMATVSGSCDVLPVDGKTPKFFGLTTHVHRRGVHTFVKDGETTLFDSTSWNHPGRTSWAAPFHTFASGKLTYQCEYVNPTNKQIVTGPLADDNELCMAIGYYFPSLDGSGQFCLNSATIY